MNWSIPFRNLFRNANSITAAGVGHHVEDQMALKRKLEALISGSQTLLLHANDIIVILILIKQLFIQRAIYKPRWYSIGMPGSLTNFDV